MTENVASGKQAWQKHPYYTYRWGAELAVDGKYSDMSYFDGKQCAISAYSKRTAEWRVDLGRLISIHHVFIQYLTNNQPWGMLCRYRSLNTFDVHGFIFVFALHILMYQKYNSAMSSFSYNEVKLCKKNAPLPPKKKNKKNPTI